LRLAPVGPSSHVYLSNRAAALLSLKRYPAAATDARRAIALAPTFGKAHARLGQALYFSKDYSAGVLAYEEALRLEPDNDVTRTYYNKAVQKRDKYRDANGEVQPSTTPTAAASPPSISSPSSVVSQASAASPLTTTEQAGTQSHAVLQQATRSAGVAEALQREENKEEQPIPQRPAAPREQPYEPEDDDPDFKQALFLQQRANTFLSKKEYKKAIEEYTAALFLIPDDPQLSPDLHLGRAHALNGCRRHESARNDARLALKLSPRHAAAFSTLAKSYFYLHEYAQCLGAFEDCESVLPPGEQLGMLDQAYQRQAREAMEEEESSLKEAGTPRAEVKEEGKIPKLPPPRFVPREEQSVSTPIPPMPSHWPKLGTSSTLKVGPELEAVFHSESLGLQLNRGTDGIVRILQVSDAPTIVREGAPLRPGLVVRQVCGVDLRRPLTNVMWGDTVALVQMAPRPIRMLVAEELVVSNSSTDAPVADASVTDAPPIAVVSYTSSDSNPITQQESVAESPQDVQVVNEESTEAVDVVTANEDTNTVDESEPPPSVADDIGGELLFRRDAPAAYSGWDNLRWLSYAGVRKLLFSESVCRRHDGEKSMATFWKAKEKFVDRQLVVFKEPSVILLLRRAKNAEELHDLLGLENVSFQEARGQYWVVLSVIGPATCRLRLSPLTTATVPCPASFSDRRKSCFLLVAPSEEIELSAVRVRNDLPENERFFSDSGAFLETSAIETVLSKYICAANDVGEPNLDGKSKRGGMLWKHQVILGTLHAAVVSGSLKTLDDAIQSAFERASGMEDPRRSPEFLPNHVVNMLDDCRLTALYYACTLRNSGAVHKLLQVGADVSLDVEEDGCNLAHVCARQLDDKCLSTILASQKPAKLVANSLNLEGRTPSYVCVVNGRNQSGHTDPAALGRCMVVLKAWGGELGCSNVVRGLSECWRHGDLAVLLQHSKYRYPLASGASVSAQFFYPLHCTLVALQPHLQSPSVPKTEVIETVKVLLGFGFEPNERMDMVNQSASLENPMPLEFLGFTPLQILAHFACEATRTRELVGEEAFVIGMQSLRDLAQLLVENGARINVEPPMITRPRTNAPTTTQIASSYHAERYDLKPKDINEYLGGEARLTMATKFWLSQTKIDAPKQTFIKQCTSFVDDPAPGGSDEKSCSICWRVFGSILGRRHKCRVSCRYVCDECSSRRLVDQEGDQRISDGQYLLARQDLKVKEVMESRAPAAVHERKAPSVSRSQQEEANRETLFGGMLEQASNFLMGEEEDTSARVSGLASALHGTRDALHERGQKLEDLGEKSAKLADASADFARMAKELRKKSEGGLFW